MGASPHRIVRCLLVEASATLPALVVGGALVLDLRAQSVAPTAVAPALVALCECALLACLLWAWTATTAVVLEALAGVRSGSTGSTGSLRVGRSGRRGGVGRGRAGGGRMVAVPAGWRRMVLAGCGVALSVGVVAPAQATSGPASPASPAAGASAGAASSLRGLPMPERPTDGQREATRTTPSPRPAPAPAPEMAPVAEVTEAAASPAGAVRTDREVVVRAGDTLWSLARADLPADLRSSPAAIGVHWRAVHELNAAVLGPDPDLIVPGQRLVLPSVQS